MIMIMTMYHTLLQQVIFCPPHPQENVSTTHAVPSPRSDPGYVFIVVLYIAVYVINW